MAKEYELVGGQPVKVSPLEVDEAGTYKAPAGQAFNPVKVSGGGGLPEVTDADNGDVLTVVEGEWAKAAPSGGGVTAVEMTYDSGEDAYMLGMKAGELYAALGTSHFATAYEDTSEEGDSTMDVYVLTSYALTSGGIYAFHFRGFDNIAFYATNANDYPSTTAPTPPET